MSHDGHGLCRGRVTEDRWILCSVKDDIAFGLQPGGELKVETTICHEVRQRRDPVIINHAADDEIYSFHPAPVMYGFESYISVPILLPNGSFFGTLCAIDPKPHMLNTPEVIGMFKLFAELIAFHLDANMRLATSEAPLLRQGEQAELREQFIAVLGHDLRNPLMAISAGVTTLIRRPERAAAMSASIQQSISRMAGLINNVLDFARGRLGGGLSLHRDASEALEQTLMQIIYEMRTSDPDRSVKAAFALDEPVYCDRERIAQLFSNLLGNAMTHGAPGQPIRVQAKASGGLFELSVANGGDPIPPHAMERLFQPFFRGGASVTQGGLGLGLYIASEIARAHGGTIEVASTVAETRFTFRMPTGTS
jgi:signal transduction histidine kinase